MTELGEIKRDLSFHLNDLKEESGHTGGGGDDQRRVGEVHRRS